MKNLGGRSKSLVWETYAKQSEQVSDGDDLIEVIDDDYESDDIEARISDEEDDLMISRELNLDANADLDKIIEDSNNIGGGKYTRYISEIPDISNLKINVSEITEVWACYGSLGIVSEVYPKRRNVLPIIKCHICNTMDGSEDDLFGQDEKEEEIDENKRDSDSADELDEL
ncbi:hypothetical protein GLOIN_2v1791410 [Rhizophagus irregularis DAOM 181602=DAOM 197198]|uniref:Uncharacterized protein n=1 Tax=Rhizophagus irregularis (strain DAOM 181602 / DAOM 197198 / MUCL 43194) TaxID=747089 RepID=A0A2P4NX82_RHIID|nr:hypothetical protein GLOIN_2v1791410 [Rhizophagus irregularis DAOM 181602=DAOM 197198]POG57708.1 hypothetical protein GLOIN_2v1791410 [Rhizophagus irregularis DAOM 181602=DAOM 197198]|eukprot:XP_025164574.1 hypothetical protein GLOIN_2v1791410 [Rhizophagus irregularis DAOM 181602=DAOM 197198]